MAGALAHFDRSTCLDETVLERIIDHITSKGNGVIEQAVFELDLSVGTIYTPVNQLTLFGHLTNIALRHAADAPLFNA